MTNFYKPSVGQKKKGWAVSDAGCVAHFILEWRQLAAVASLRMRMLRCRQWSRYGGAVCYLALVIIFQTDIMLKKYNS